jgi:hypothetical protein
MTQIDIVFSEVRGAMQAELFPLGFVVFDDEDGGPFGSKLIELHRDKLGIRFFWDGKESWFSLQKCQEVSLGPLPVWHDVLFKRVDLNSLDVESSEHLIQSFRNSIAQVAEDYQAA